MTSIFSRLDSANLPIQGSDLLLIDQQNPLSPTGYTTRKTTAFQLSGIVTTLATIAQLRLRLKTIQAPYAFVLGYYAQGDGGGGQYWYDPSDTTSSDNGGTIIVAGDGGRWKLVVQFFVSCCQFGAVAGGNAATNATCLQAWVNYLGTSKKTGFIPGNTATYDFSTTLTYTYSGANSGLKIIGESSGNYNSTGPGSVLRYTGASGHAFLVNGDGPVNTHFEGFTVRVVNANCDTLYFSNVWNLKLIDMTAQGVSTTGLAAVTLFSTGAAGGFCGNASIVRLRTEQCDRGVLISGVTGAQVNVVHIYDLMSLDGRQGVVSDWGANTPFTNDVLLDGIHMENPTGNFVASLGAAQNWRLDGYLEMAGTSFNGDWVSITGGGNSSLRVSGVNFVGSLNNAGNRHVYALNCAGVYVRNNSCSAGGANDRFTVETSLCTGVEVEPANTQPGASLVPYPVKVNGNIFSAGPISEVWNLSFPTGSGKYVGISSGDGYPGGTVATLNANSYTRSNGKIRAVLKSTIATKSGSGTQLLIGVLPFSNSGPDEWFPVYTSNLTGTGPFHGILPSGSNVAQIYDATNTAVNYQTACSVGTVIVATIEFLTQS